MNDESAAHPNGGCPRRIDRGAGDSAVSFIAVLGGKDADPTNAGPSPSVVSGSTTQAASAQFAGPSRRARPWCGADLLEALAQPHSKGDDITASVADSSKG
jgi:hypothetical protein